MKNTHMPFIAENAQERIELCCRKVNGFWKLHRLMGSDWIQLKTGREEDAVECSPTAEFYNNEWHISFIALGATGNRLARLYEMVGNTVHESVSPAAVGFVRHDMKVFSSEMQRFTIEYSSHKKKIITCAGWTELLRISYDPVYLSNLLISCRYQERICSWLYNLSSGKLFDIEVNGEPAYKCAFYQGKCYYAKCIGDNFEDREIIETDNISLTPINENIISIEWEE